MTDMTAGSAADEPHPRLTDEFIAQGTATSETVEAASRTMPRHAFVPGVTLEAAYAQGSAGIKKGRAPRPRSARWRTICTVAALAYASRSVRNTPPGFRPVQWPGDRQVVCQHRVVLSTTEPAVHGQAVLEKDLNGHANLRIVRLKENW